MYGGISNNGPQNDIWRLNLNLEVWDFVTEVSDFNPLFNFAYTTYTRNNTQYLCIFGGIDNNYLSQNLHM